MTTNFRTLCVELLEKWDDPVAYQISDFVDDETGNGIIDRIRAKLAEPKPEPADGELAELVEGLRLISDGMNAIGHESDSWFVACAATLLERLDRYDQALSAVMPPDFKDWWENSKDEWPDVAAGVIENLRKREELAWEQLDRVTASFH